MHAYIVHPSVTLKDNEIANNFYRACRNELESNVGVTSIASEMAMQTIRTTNGDVLVFFNRDNRDYPDYLIDFLHLVVVSRCAIFPVAVSETHRVPPEIVSTRQSFDIQEELRQRKLMESQVETVGIVLARVVISQLQPTLSIRDMFLFLSHRRSDGERIAGAFHDQLQIRMQNTFRDLNRILVGEESQEIIIKNLRKSDAVIFFDTPMCGESEWIERELRAALSMNIPIVWVKIGSNEGRTQLNITPMGEPHFQLHLKPDNVDVDSKLVDDVIQKAFEISREFAKHVFSYLKRIRAMADKGSIQLKEVSQQYMTYQIEVPRNGFRYAQRPMTHVVGFYGRHPHDEDLREFLDNLSHLGYDPHPLLGVYYDAAVMVAPIASYPNEHVSEQPHIIDSGDEYISILEHYVRSTSQPSYSNRRGVIISGAFPDCEPEHQQHVTDAVHAFAQAVFDRGGKVIFGAHPTFQHLIFDMAKQRRPQDYINAVHLYVSKHFVTDAFVVECRNDATVTETGDLDNDRAKSLTLMRQRMIQDDEVAGMVVIGGKTQRPNIPPGIDEEIELARTRDLPVFIVGSAGGRAAELASKIESEGWASNKINQAPVQFNHELLVSLDYNVLAYEILDHLGI
jgi:hypothetical protein